MYPCSLALTGPDARGNTHAPMLGKPGQAAVGTATRTDCRRTHVGGGGMARGSNTHTGGTHAHTSLYLTDGRTRDSGSHRQHAQNRGSQVTHSETHAHRVGRAGQNKGRWPRSDVALLTASRRGSTELSLLLGSD